MSAGPSGRAAPALALLLLAAACSGDATWPEFEALEAPAALDDGWDVAAPPTQGFDPTVMKILDQRLRHRDLPEVDAILVARRGVLVYEGYSGPFAGADRRHFLASATKSVASMVVGVAQQKGLVGDLDASIAPLFPEAEDLFAAEPRKRDITLRHVLTMTAGLDWDRKAVTDRDRDDIRIKTAPDAVRYVLEKPLVEPPGTRFFYNSGASMLLTGLIPNVSGMEADAFAREHLFGPLGILDWLWQTTDDGTARGQDGLHMRARDLLKLGQLYLEGGRWKGVQLVSPAWIEASFRPWTPTDWGYSNYGFQWWTYPLERPGRPPLADGVVFASGFGGQKLFIVPELDLVAVFFGCTRDEFGGISYECGDADVVPELVMWNYVLRALRDA
ncbi:MAG TPA: serine hydrolase [Longimicrobiales bacterium]|nr:serine hydrolase [Longimicrobiales bacterium]